MANIVSSDEKEEPLNADELADTQSFIRSAIEERDAAQNRINAAKMAAGNVIPAGETYARAGIVFPSYSEISSISW